MADTRITPLQAALLSGSMSRIKLILKTEFPLNEGIIDKLNGCQEVIHFLLDQKQNYNIRDSNYSTLLHFAAMHRDNESFHLLLEDSNININAHFSRQSYYKGRCCLSAGTTLLHIVAMRGTYEMTKALLERGADVNARSTLGLIPLHLACSNIKFLIGNIITSSSPELPKDPKIVQLLLEHGSFLETETFHTRETPLLLSCQCGYLEIFKLLLQYGANFNVRCKFGKNILHKAVQYAHPGLTKIILDMGFDSNGQECRGRTSIHEYLLNSGLPEVLDLLIKYGADINSRDYRGNTPLHTACTQRSCNDLPILLKYFLKRNPDINALNKSGETPLNVALQCRELYSSNAISPLKINVCESLCKHIAKLKAADKYICKENLSLIQNDPEIRKLYKRFELELNKMKEEEISSSSNFCYFYILKASPAALAAFIRNEKIMKSFASKKYKRLFPLYSDCLTECINVAIIKRDLTKTCASRLRKHVKRNLPYLIVDNIFSYLNEEDLKNFEEAFLNFRN